MRRAILVLAALFVLGVGVYEAIGAPIAELDTSVDSDSPCYVR
jgi:hypothetical protein